MIFLRRTYLEDLLGKTMKAYLRNHRQCSIKSSQSSPEKVNMGYYKLPYLGFLSTWTNREFSNVVGKNLLLLILRLSSFSSKWAHNFSPKIAFTY